MTDIEQPVATQVSMKLNIEREDLLNLRRLGDKPYLLVEVAAGEEEGEITLSATAGGPLMSLEAATELAVILNTFFTQGLVEELPVWTDLEQ